MHIQTTKQVLLESVQGLALHAQPHITMHQHTQYCQYTSATQHVINMLRLTCRSWHTETKQVKQSCAWATCIQQWCGCTHIVVMCLDTQHCKLYLSHGVMSCVHMLCMCGRMWNVDCISWSMCACLCLLFMHAVQLHISCEFVCAVCGALCVSSLCVWVCVCVYVDHWLHWHEHEQMDQWTCSDANHERPLFLPHKLKNYFLGQQKRLLASQHLAKKILANVPECTQQKHGCSSHWSSAFSASATAAAHSLIWQHRTLGMNTDYWHLEWTPTLINTQLKVPLYAHPWASLWPSQLSKDMQLQNTYQQHAPTTTPSITTKSMLRERLPSGIFLVWYMS